MLLAIAFNDYSNTLKVQHFNSIVYLISLRVLQLDKYCIELPTRLQGTKYISLYNFIYKFILGPLQ